MSGNPFGRDRRPVGRQPKVCVVRSRSAVLARGVHADTREMSAVGKRTLRPLCFRVTRVAYALLATTAVAVVACAKDGDTCTGGANMTNPRLVAGLESAAGATFVRITWDPGTGLGAELGRSYFATVRLLPATLDAGVAVAEAPALTGDREIRVEIVDTRPPPKTLSFELAFDDRARHVDCRHPGMADQYVLAVAIDVDASSEVTRTELAERVILGDI